MGILGRENSWTNIAGSTSDKLRMLSRGRSSEDGGKNGQEGDGDGENGLHFGGSWWY